MLVSCCSLYFPPNLELALPAPLIRSVCELPARQFLFPFHCEYGLADAPRGQFRQITDQTNIDDIIGSEATLVTVHFRSETQTAKQGDWTAKFEYNAMWGYCFIGVDSAHSSSLIQLTTQFYDCLSEQMIIIYGYGYGFMMTENNGPTEYGLGITYYGASSDPSKKYRRLNSLWSTEIVAHQRHLTGHLRQVYPVNILSNNHLNWITGSIAALGIGELRSLLNGGWVWVVPEDELLQASEYLIAHDRLICFDQDDRIH
jgi:hypothetical protein